MNSKVYKQEKLGPGAIWKKAMIEKYADFNSRATRREYWYVQIINTALFMVLYVVMFAALGGDPDSLETSDDVNIVDILPIIGFFLLALASVIPSIALGVRRLHDINRSGWWILINFIPFGFIVLLVFNFTRGDEGENDYGPPAEYVG